MDRLTEYLFPKQVSTFAADIDNLFYFIFYSSIVLFAIVVLGMMYLAIKYRFKKGDEVKLTSSKDHSNILEALFFIVPLILVSITFVWGIKSYLQMIIVPDDAIEIKVTGQSWSWTFDYPDGGTTLNELVVPSNTPIKIVLSSKDVLQNSISGLEINRVVHFSPYFCYKEEKLLLGFTLSCSLKNRFNWTKQEFEKNGIDTSGLKGKEGFRIHYILSSFALCIKSYSFYSCLLLHLHRTALTNWAESKGSGPKSTITAICVTRVLL